MCVTVDPFINYCVGYKLNWLSAFPVITVSICC